MSDSHRFTVVGGTAAVKGAIADKTIPQDTLLPLLDAPLDDLATYLARDSWEDRKNYLDRMMGASVTSLLAQTVFFKDKGLPKSEWFGITEMCLVALHVKIGQLLDAWGAPEVPPDEHAAALFVLSAKSEHRRAVAKWMPGGTTSPPEENKLFEAGTGLMIFKNISMALRPALSECWRQELKELQQAKEPPAGEARP